VPVEAGKEEVLLLEAGRRRRTRSYVAYAQQEVDAIYALGGADGSGTLRGCDDVGAGGGSGRRGRDGVGVGVEDATNLAEAVVGEEEEETVFDDGTADGAAELLLLVDGLGEKEGVSVVVEGLELVVGIEGVQRWIAEVVEGVAVDCVGA